MRSDNLRGHMKRHKDLLALPEDEFRKEVKARHEFELSREAKRQRLENIALEEGIPIPKEIASSKMVEDTGDLKERMLQEQNNYLEKLELGRKVSDILETGEIDEQSLPKDLVKALELYRKNRPRFDIASIKLWPWQAQAFELVTQPTERKVIWISGRQGGEGKSVFQRYVEAYFGFQRVFCADLRIKHPNMCKILRKRNLPSIDIFCFNDGRSVSGEDLNMYRILEDIKDGQATTSKYNNDNIRFKVPNVVMIFSNGYPDVKKLSRDRWTIFHANMDGLKNVTGFIMKMKKAGLNANNEEHVKRHIEYLKSCNSL